MNFVKPHFDDNKFKYIRCTRPPACIAVASHEHPLMLDMHSHLVVGLSSFEGSVGSGMAVVGSVTSFEQGLGRRAHALSGAVPILL